MYQMHQTLFASYSNPLRVVDAADFDGTNDFIRRAALTGAADSKTGILSFWLRLDGGDGSGLQLMMGGTGALASFGVARSASNVLSISGQSSAGGSTVLSMASASTYTAGATWRHLLASWDLANAAGHLYVNDVQDRAGSPTLTDSIVDYTVDSWTIGAAINDVFKTDGALAELYFAPGQYLDFSLVHNRRKFISASGKPVHLGTDGSMPTGTAPLVYLHLDDAEAVANFATNRGTGGDFSITGTLETGSSSPSD
jgi:hypothetical protein